MAVSATTLDFRLKLPAISSPTSELMSSTVLPTIQSRLREYELDESPSMINPSPRRKASNQTANEAAKSISQPRSSRNKSSKADKDTGPRTWLCLCNEGISGYCERESKCMCMRYLENNSDHPYLTTKKGDDLLRYWNNEASDRDPEWWEINPNPNPKAWSEFSDSGMVEAIENMVSICMLMTLGYSG